MFGFENRIRVNNMSIIYNITDIHMKRVRSVFVHSISSAVPGVSPGRGLLMPLGYLHPGKCEYSEVQSHPPCHGRWTFDGFRRYAHARVITDFKNMAD